MTDAEPAPSEIRRLDWENLGDSDWSATAPGGWRLSYQGPRLGLGYSTRLRLTAEISLARGGQARGHLQREGDFDRLAKRWGYAVEHQTGDANFDREIYLCSDDPALARALGEHPAARRAVLDLLDHQVAWVSIGHTGWTARLTESPQPAEDDGARLSALALRLCALAQLWPAATPAPSRAVGKAIRHGVGVAWAVVVAGLTFARWSSGDAAAARQIETFADTDWLGMGLLVLVGVGPFAVLAARQARAHRTLVCLVMLMLAALPFSQPLLQVDINRLYNRSTALAPLTAAELRIDPDRQWSRGYLLGGVVEDLPAEWTLTPEQGRVAADGGLCASAVVAEGLRTLRYVRELRAWPCRPGESSPIPAAPPPSS